MHSPRPHGFDGAELFTPQARPAALVFCPIFTAPPGAMAGAAQAMIYQLAYERSLEESRRSLSWSALVPSSN